MPPLLWIEIKLIACHSQGENSFTHFHWMYKEKLNKKERRTCRWERMSKAIEENKLTVMIKRLFWRFNLCLKFMCADKNNDKNKTNIPPTLLPPFYYCYSFLNCWTTTKSMTLKFWDFRFVSISCFERNWM